MGEGLACLKKLRSIEENTISCFMGDVLICMDAFLTKY